MGDKTNLLKDTEPKVVIHYPGISLRVEEFRKKYVTYNEGVELMNGLDVWVAGMRVLMNDLRPITNNTTCVLWNSNDR